MSAGTSQARRHSRAYALLALAAAPIGVLVALRPWRLALPGSFYLPVHVTLEALVIAGGLATFAVQWFASGAGAFREPRARFIGPAFLGAAILALAHLLSFPGMPGFLGPATTERGIAYWLATRVLTVAALLLAARLGWAERSPLIARRRFLIAANLLVAVGVILVEVSLPPARAVFFEEGRGLTPLKVTLETLVAVASAVGAYLHGRTWHRTGEPAAGKLAVALVLGVYGELCLMLYATAYDLFNVAGHLYLVASFWFVFDALFVAALLRPYAALDALRAHVENELVVTIERLRLSTAQREELLRAVSHDVRNPLQIVTLQAQRLLRGPGDERTRRSVAGILTAARRIDRMLRDLVDSDGATLALAWERIHLHAFVAQLLEGSDGVLDVTRVENDVPADLPPVRADPDRLDRILANLVGNALKYSEGKVRIHAERSADDVTIAVIDRGPGIPADDLRQIFERSYRGQRHEGEGLGLGLFIVRKLVEAHGGRIAAESRVGEGCTFTFTLPLGTAEVPAPRVRVQR